MNDYLNQKAVFMPALRDNEGGATMDCRGNILYGAEADIPVRRENAMKDILTRDKQVLRITDTFYADTELRAGDMLDGKRVLYAEDWVGLDGEIIGYMAVV